MNAVTLQVHEQGLVQNLRHAFTSRSLTVIRELLQNARRAGATKAELVYEENSLTISDDGCGIENFADLLNIAKSGWDIETAKIEHPYGLGFLSAIYAADTIEVVSGRQRLFTKTEDILNFRPIEITETDNEHMGVMIRLHGLHPGSVVQNLESTLQRECRGFPIPVYVNGKKQESDHAADDTFVDSPIGKIRLGRSASGIHLVCYYQGLPVDHPRFDRGSTTTVVHLDTEVFTARLPDRDTLIDGDIAYQKISEAVEAAWKTHLQAEKARLDGPGFINRYFHDCLALKYTKILNDIAYLPGHLFYRVDEPQVQKPWERFVWQSSLYRNELFYKGHLSSQRLAKLDDLEAADWRDEEETDAAAAILYAHLSGAITVDLDGLDEGHWIHAMVKDLTACEWEVIPHNMTGSVDWRGDRTSAKLVFCERYTLRNKGTGEMLDIDSVALYCHYGINGHTTEATIVYPVNCASSDVLSQMSSFSDDDTWMEREETEERERFNHFVLLHREKDAAHVIKQVLQQGMPDMEGALNGRVYQVRVDECGCFEISLIAA